MSENIKKIENCSALTDSANRTVFDTDWHENVSFRFSMDSFTWAWAQPLAAMALKETSSMLFLNGVNQNESSINIL